MDAGWSAYSIPLAGQANFVVVVVVVVVGWNQRLQIPGFAMEGSASTSRDTTGQPDVADVDVGCGGVMVSLTLDAMSFGCERGGSEE